MRWRRAWRWAWPPSRWATADPPTAGETRFWVAYTGVWDPDGSVLSTRVDAAHPADRIGTDQVRQVRWEGARVVLQPPPRMVRGVMNHLELEWEKVG